MINISILRTAHFAMIVLHQTRLTLVKDVKSLYLTNFILHLMFIGIFRALFVKNAKKTSTIVGLSLPKINLII